jgi:hypothetical protein
MAEHDQLMIALAAWKTAETGCALVAGTNGENCDRDAQLESKT